MSTASPTTPVTPTSVDEKFLLVDFERQHIPSDYREYYAIKRNNFFASIQGFQELWELYLRLDAIWLRGIGDLYVARDRNTMFPLLLYINVHAKIRVAMELAFTGCMSEARSILRDAVEFVAHAHAMVNKPQLQQTWLNRSEDADALKAFRSAFEWDKKVGLFKGLEELHKVWGQLSETGSHANINALIGRFVQIEDEKHITFKLNYTGVEDERLWRTEIFTMLLSCSTMVGVFLSDYDARLKLDNTLMQMRGECDRVKEHVREILKRRYKMEPPGGIHSAPRPTIFRP